MLNVPIDKCLHSANFPFMYLGIGAHSVRRVLAAVTDRASHGHRTPIPHQPWYDIGTSAVLETSGGEISAFAIDVGVRLIQLWLIIWGRASARTVPMYDTLRRPAMMISLGVEDVGLRISLDVSARNSLIS